jgi:uncharacterized membrane-anchored protein
MRHASVKRLTEMRVEADGRGRLLVIDRALTSARFHSRSFRRGRLPGDRQHAPMQRLQ